MEPTTITTEDSKVVTEGDRVFNFYDCKWGVIAPGSIDSDGWFDLDQEDGTRKFLNGKRVVSYDPRDNGGRPGVVSTTEDRKAANEASAATGPDSSAPINVDHLADELGAQLQATIQEFWAKAAEAHGFALSAATVAAQAPIDRVVEYATLRLVEALEEG